MSNILLIGGGGREHALAWGLRKSPRVKEIFCAPGNAGIASLATCVNLPLDKSSVLAFLKEKKIDLTVVGPEAPLADGLADWIREAGGHTVRQTGTAPSGGRVFGVGKAAAQLEASKVFAKNFMKRHGIPTAGFEVFTSADDALSYVNAPAWNPNMRVVKASGLAAGKGVIVCKDRDEVVAAIATAMVKKEFGAAGDQIILEEILTGDELSVIALCDGKTLLPLSPAQDHKRIFDNDEGPNTGGMGTYAPAPMATPELWKEIETKIFQPFLRGLAADKLPYSGVVFFGLMLPPSGPQVLEFNVRFGDPETQVVVPLVENDWLDLFNAAVDGKLSDVQLKKKPGAAVCVVLTAKGYPGAYEKGKTIAGLDKAAARPDVTVFHAGTAKNASGAITTSGGRVLGVTALGNDLESACRKAYDAVKDVQFEGAHYRKDIAARALRNADIGLRSVK